MTKRCLFFYLGCLCVILIVWLYQSPQSEELSLEVSNGLQDTRQKRAPEVEQIVPLIEPSIDK